MGILSKIRSKSVYKYIMIAVLGCIMVVTIWGAHRIYLTYCIFASHRRADIFEDHRVSFNWTVSHVFRLIKENDGYIPADLHGTLIDDAKGTSFVYKCEPLSVPVRINPDLGKNEKIILFWSRGPENGRWGC